MPRLDHFQPSTDDWPAVRSLWLDWVNGNRPDLVNMQAMADEAKVPLATLNKKTARWKREEQDRLAKLQADLAQQAFKLKPTKGPRAKVKEPAKEREQREATGTRGRVPVNASENPRSSSLLYTDQFRQARELGKEAMTAAMQGLVEEATYGTGASRVAAIRELLDRAGLAKDLEKRDEVSPYEHEEGHVLQARLVELLGHLPMFNSLLQAVAHGTAAGSGADPTTSQGAPFTRPITTLPDGSVLSAELPVVPVVEALGSGGQVAEATEPEPLVNPFLEGGVPRLVLQ